MKFFVVFSIFNKGEPMQNPLGTCQTLCSYGLLFELTPIDLPVEWWPTYPLL